MNWHLICEINRTYSKGVVLAAAGILLLAAVSYSQPVPSLSKVLDEQFARAFRDQTAGEYDAAIATYTGYLKARPKDAKAWFNRGLSYHSKAQTSPTRELYQSSISDLSEAIKLEPANEKAWLARGQTYLAMRSIDPLRISPLVIADMTEAIRLNPKLQAAYQGRGEAYWELNDPKKAEADLTEAIRLDPKDAYSFYKRGTVRWNMDPDGAKADFQAAIDLNPAYESAKRSLTALNSQASAKTGSAKSSSPAAAPIGGRPQAPPVAMSAPPISDNRGVGPGMVEIMAADADMLIDSGQPDRAIPRLEKALSLIPAGGQDTFSKLQAVRRQSLIKEKLARAYLVKKDYARSLDTYHAAQMELFKSLNEDMDDLNRAMEKLVGTGVNIALYESRIPTAMDLFQVGEQALKAFNGIVLPNELMMKPLVIGVAKLGAGETLAAMLRNLAGAKLAVAAECRSDRAKCGPGTRTAEPANLIAAALADINKAIAVAPAVKNLYATRADVHRALGDAASAAADDARAAKK